MSIVVLYLLTFIVSFVGTYFFRVSSISRYVMAKPNLRTIHEKPTKSGGGIIFSILSSKVFEYFSGFIAIKNCPVPGGPP